MFGVRHSSYATTIETVQHICQSTSQIAALAVVGSMTRDFVPLPYDIDFLAITEVHISDEALVDSFRHETPKNIAVEKWYRNEDTLRTRIADIPVGVAFREKNGFDAVLQEILEGRSISPVYQSWAVFGAVPEVICADIVDATILFDKAHWLEDWRRRLETYPSALRSSILGMSSQDLSAKAAIADSALRTGDFLAVEFSIYSSLLHLLRGHFAAHYTYFRGMKHLAGQLARFLPHTTNLILAMTSVSSLSWEEKIEELYRSADYFNNLIKPDTG